MSNVRIWGTHLVPERSFVDLNFHPPYALTVATWCTTHTDIQEKEYVFSEWFLYPTLT